MQETICTIPINDLFAQTDGCPICRMYKMIEKQYVEYITGAAMMAPDVRVETNKKGFCHKHYEMMMSTGPKLSNALLMQTRLEYIKSNMLPDKLTSKPSKANLENIRNAKSSCYVCDRIDFDVNHLLSTVFAQVPIDNKLKEQFLKQDYLCLNHYELVVTRAMQKGGVKSKYLPEFIEAANTLCKKYIDTLYDDVTHFTTMFDYRNAGGDWKNSKDSVERSVKFITSNEVKEVE